MAWCGFRVRATASTTQKLSPFSPSRRGGRDHLARLFLFVLLSMVAVAFFGGSWANGALGPTTATASPHLVPPTPSPHALPLATVQPAGNTSSPPGWYCPGGTARQTSSASQRLDLCTFVSSRSPTFSVLYYANVTVLGTVNVTGNYSWAFSFGDGTNATQSTAFNLSGSWLHGYTANGTYSLRAAVTDSVGSLNVTVPITVSLNVSAMSIALSSYESTTPNGSTTTTFSCTIAGGLPNYDFQYAFGDGTYYLDNTSTSTGSCSASHAYGHVSSATNYTVDVHAWDGSGHNASASVSVTPTYNYNNSSSGGTGGHACGGVLASGPNATAGSSAVLYLSSANVRGWYLYAWAPHLNLSWNATLTLGNTSASLAMGGLATSHVGAACVAVNWGDHSPPSNHSITAAGATALSVSHTYYHSGFYSVSVAISNGTAGAVANISFRLNFSAGSTGGSGGGLNNSTSGSLVTQLVSSSAHDRWLVQVWVPGVSLNTTADLYIGNLSATLWLNSSVLASSGSWAVAGFLSPGGTWALNSSFAGAVYGYVLSQAYNVSGSYRSAESLTQGNASAAANFTFALNFAPPSNNSTRPYPTTVTVTVGAAPVTGAAPLTVTLSAYISGGSAPFVAVWSLPGSASGSNVTGLMVTTTYNLSGWYPATAFVYNTTSSYGSVLVGYGSVWLYVTGNLSGGGSGGNGSGNHSGKTPIPGASTAGLAPPPAMSLTAALLVAVATGGLAGGAAGFAVGRGPVRRHPSSHDTPVPSRPR